MIKVVLVILTVQLSGVWLGFCIQREINRRENAEKYNRIEKLFKGGK